MTIVDETGAPVDLTGATIRATISTGTGAVALITKTSGSTADIVIADQGSEPGIVSIVFLPQETALFPVLPGRLLYYRVWLIFNSENQDPVADGFITVQK